MVAINPLIVVILSPAKIPLCEHVMVTPEDNKITVFHNGNPHASKDIMYLGGQIHPTIAEGDKLQWKKAQKNQYLYIFI
jgi:hypothetical protein